MPILWTIVFDKKNVSCVHQIHARVLRIGLQHLNKILVTCNFSTVTWHRVLPQITKVWLCRQNKTSMRDKAIDCVAEIHVWVAWTFHVVTRVFNCSWLRFLWQDNDHLIVERTKPESIRPPPVARAHRALWSTRIYCTTNSADRAFS